MVVNNNLLIQWILAAMSAVDMGWTNKDFGIPISFNNKYVAICSDMSPYNGGNACGSYVNYINSTLSQIKITSYNNNSSTVGILLVGY